MFLLNGPVSFLRFISTFSSPFKRFKKKKKKKKMIKDVSSRSGIVFRQRVIELATEEVEINRRNVGLI